MYLSKTWRGLRYEWSSLRCRCNRGFNRPWFELWKMSMLVGIFRSNRCMLQANLIVFQRFERPRSFDDAESRCYVFGGHLTSIHSFMENDFIGKIAENGTFTGKTDRLTWIGLKRKHNTEVWTWTDGSPYGYNKWAGHPENKTQEKCAQMVSTFTKEREIVFKGLWHDANCNSNATYFICKKKA
ncbi:lectin C-type domain protein [Ancylostoma caninum]|uniref:Lectin C-type domain protein n=1 Tax=Ancylostoma caninum TaxID=29170 RepID=A0A368GPE7_ANCCA|nr:lectin C-type domain protein [Ancylostoma caninum]